MDAISPLNDLGATRTLDKSADPNPGLESSSNRFAALLAQPEPSHPMPEVGATSTISQVLGQHDQMYRQLIHDLEQQSLRAPLMKPEELTMRQCELMFRITNVSAQNNAYSYLAQSCKNGVQTLMKNQ